MIDEKGRLFGKINIIDLLVILLVLVVAVVVGLKFLNRNAGAPGSGGVLLEYTVRVAEVRPEVYAALKPHVDAGDANLMANGELLNGQITAVAATPCMKQVETADGRLVYAEDPQLLDLVFTIKATVTNAVTQAVGTQEVRIGKAHIVKTRAFELVNGIILTCEPVTAAG